MGLALKAHWVHLADTDGDLDGTATSASCTVQRMLGGPSPRVENPAQIDGMHDLHVALMIACR